MGLERRSIYEVVRVFRKLGKAEFAAELGQSRQWYTKKSTPGGRYTAAELKKLFEHSGMSKSRFLEHLLAEGS